MGHAARRFTIYPPDSTDRILKRTDFRNAFNSVDKNAMLLETRKKIPPFMYYCHDKSSYHCFGNELINFSERGIDQEDPLGPAIFCLVVDETMKFCKCEFNFHICIKEVLAREKK